MGSNLYLCAFEWAIFELTDLLTDSKENELCIIQPHNFRLPHTHMLQSFAAND